MVIVNVPKDSSYPSVSITFAGLYGTIAGMSSMGLTGIDTCVKAIELAPYA